ncbi:MAG TPA: sodium:solute symporter family protein [Woeseiaceae bacterium]|nr:sodium:solute symporter family protein [Woeseiaceae bacterium]
MLERIDLAVIALYFAVSLGVGYWASRQIQSAEDFSVAGGRLKFPVLLGTLLATAIGASATMGRAGKAYEVGLIIFFAGFAYAAGLYLFSYLAPIIKRIGVWTVPEALHLRYGRNFRLLASVVILFALTGVFSAQLNAFGVVVVTLLPDAGISYEQAVVVSAAIMVAYTALGGLLAVAYTDVMQAVVMVIAIGVLLPLLVVADMGGPSVAVAGLAMPAGGWLGGLTVMYLVAIFLIDVPISMLDVSLWQRTGAAQSVDHIRKGVRITAGAFVIWSFIVVALGIYAAELLPDLESTQAGADAAIPSLVLEYMPPFVKGLCLAALLAIIMSTADTVLLIGGTTISMDILPFVRDDMDSDRQIRVARWSVLAIGAIGVLISISVRSVFELLLIAFAIYVAALFVPTMLAFFWKKATRAGAVSSTIAAFISVLYLYYQKFNGNLPEFIEPIFVSQLLSLLIMVIVSLMTYREEEASTRLIDLPARD